MMIDIEGIKKRVEEGKLLLDEIDYFVRDCDETEKCFMILRSSMLIESDIPLLLSGVEQLQNKIATAMQDIRRVCSTCFYYTAPQNKCSHGWGVSDPDDRICCLRDLWKWRGEEE